MFDYPKFKSGEESKKPNQKFEELRQNMFFCFENQFGKVMFAMDFPI